MTVKVSPTTVDVADTAYKPAVLIGGDAALGDDLDSTYAEQWLSRRGGVQDGPLIRAHFAPYGGGAASVILRMRFEVDNELGATGTRFFVAAYLESTGEEVGLFHMPGDPASLPSAGATGAIYDLTDWDFELTSTTTDLNTALIAGMQVRIRRLPEAGDEFGSADADWMIRVYELNMLAQGGGSPPLRRWPPIRNNGMGPMQHFPNTGARRYPSPY